MMRRTEERCRNIGARILILSALLMMAVLPFIPAASARSFMVYNNSLPSQAYFIVNGTTGYAGVGLLNPAYPLDVSGAGRFSGNLYLGTAGRYVYDTGSIIGVSSGLLLGGNLDLGGNNLTNYNYLYSNDSGKLNGQAASYYLDTSSTAQTKSGSLTVTGTWLNATNLNVSSNAYVGGNVGIGTASPITKLDVNGIVRPTGWTDPTSGTGLEMGWTGSESRIYSQNRSGGGWQPLALAGSNIQLLVGNVGIGTTGPDTPLHIRKDAVGDVRLLTLGNELAGGWGTGVGAGKIQSIVWRDNTAVVAGWGAVYDGTTSVDLTAFGMYNSGFKDESTRVFTIKGTGNVGIGTIDPAGYKLRVAGTVRGTSFTDEDNTAYYVDPAGNSVMNTINSGTPITSANIGSQSVNYANSAGSAPAAVHDSTKHSGLTQNELSGMTPTFSGWNTNPGTNANLVDDTTLALTTTGVIPNGNGAENGYGPSASIQYDLGSAKRRFAAMRFSINYDSPNGRQVGARITVSTDGSTWFPLVPETVLDMRGERFATMTIGGYFRYIQVSFRTAYAWPNNINQLRIMVYPFN